MTHETTYTQNLRLAKPAADRKNWSELQNNNWQMIDAAISSFFIIQQFTGPWTNSTPYVLGDVVLDTVGGGLYVCNQAHNSASAPTTFAQDQAAHPTYWAAYSSAGVGRGVWTANTSYRKGDFVVSSNKYAVCLVTHVSSNNFNDDVGLGKWAVLIDFSLVSAQPLPILGGLADANKFAVSNSTGTGWITVNAEDARTLLGGTSVGKAVFIAPSQDAALSALGGTTTGKSLFTAASTDNALTLLGFGAFGKQLSQTVTAAEANALLGIASGPVVVGSMVTDLSTPAGYIEANGAAVSRATYSALFAKYGVTFGAGDGLTTFNLPLIPTIVAYASDGTPVALKTFIRV